MNWGLGFRVWGLGKEEEDLSPVPSARITGEDLTQRRGGAEAQREEGKKGRV